MTISPEHFNLIQRTVRQCLSYCKQREMPLSALSRFVEDLRDMGWPRSDVRAVERAALSRLTADCGDGFD